MLGCGDDLTRKSMGGFEETAGAPNDRLRAATALPTASATNRELTMYIARFSYDVLPVNRQAAITLIRREAVAALRNGRAARLLTPLTRPHGGAALQFEIELASLDDLEQFRREGVGDDDQTREWMRQFDEILLSPPLVEIFRIDRQEG